MKIFSASIFCTIFLVVFSFTGQGQYVVKKVSDQPVNTAQDGFFYSLPSTVLKIEVVYEKLEKIKGPLADYSLNYLGTSNYIDANSTEYQLINVDISVGIQADPKQLYYVQFPSERNKDEKAMVFSLSSYGTLLGFDESGVDDAELTQPLLDQTFIMIDSDKNFDLQADYNRKKKLDTIKRRITIDTVSIDRFVFKTSWIDKNDEDKADEAAMQIARIREGRFNLLTGYQEVNYGESMRYMDNQLRKLENQYLELFLGKELKSIESQTIYYTPKKESLSETILKLDDGSEVSIKLTPINSIVGIPERPLEKADNIYYRIPEQAIVEISHKGMMHLRKGMTINQLGVVGAAPLNRTRTQFDPKTGGLKRIIRE